MGCCKILTWILLLPIVSFALGAPVTVRERLEMFVDVDVAQGASGTATSQKRHDPLDDWSTTNAADRPPSPPMLTPSELDRLWEEVAEQPINRYSPPTPESPTFSTESVDSSWSIPELPTTVSHLSLTGGSPLPPHPGPPHDHFPSPLGISASVNPNTFSSTGNLQPPMPPQRPAGGSPPPYTGPSEGRFPTTPGGSPLPNPGSSEDRFPITPGASPLPYPGSSEDRFPITPGASPPSYTGPSEGRFPTTPGASPLSYPGPSDGGFLHSPGWWESTSPSTGHQPTPPQIPTGSSALPALPHPGPPSEDRFEGSSGWLVDPNFLDDLLKGRIKRRLSGSSTVDSVQRDSIIQGQQNIF